MRARAASMRGASGARLDRSRLGAAARQGRAGLCRDERRMLFLCALRYLCALCVDPLWPEPPTHRTIGNPRPHWTFESFIQLENILNPDVSPSVRSVRPLAQGAERLRLGNLFALICRAVYLLTPSKRSPCFLRVLCGLRVSILEKIHVAKLLNYDSAREKKKREVGRANSTSISPGTIYLDFSPADPGTGPPPRGAAEGG